MLKVCTMVVAMNPERRVYTPPVLRRETHSDTVKLRLILGHNGKRQRCPQSGNIRHTVLYAGGQTGGRLPALRSGYLRPARDGPSRSGGRSLRVQATG